MDNKYNVLINSQSGTASSLGQERIERWIRDSELQVERLYFLHADNFSDKLSDFITSDHPLLVGGGDGTIKHVAFECLKQQFQQLEKTKAFGILPMGTMNLLAKDLDIPVDPHDAINAYAQGSESKTIDAGFVNDELFLCNAALGAIPESAEMREACRDEHDTVVVPRLTVFVMDQMDQNHHRSYSLQLDSGEINVQTPMLVVSNNCFMNTNFGPEQSLKRASLNGNVLGIYSSQPRNLWDKVRFFARIKSGGWKNDPVVNEWTSQVVTLASGQDSELISLDGENMELATPLEFKVKHDAVKVLIPAGGEA